MLFKDIVGNEVAKSRLLNTVRDSRVSHAQLFLGPEGSGKVQLAIAYAQYINCTNRTVNQIPAVFVLPVSNTTSSSIPTCTLFFLLQQQATPKR